MSFDDVYCWACRLKSVALFALTVTRKSLLVACCDLFVGCSLLIVVC